MAPTCQLCGYGGWVQEWDNSLCPPFCLGKTCLPDPALMPDTSAPPCVPLVSFKLRPWCWSSEGVSLSKCVYGFFKENCLGLQKFLPLTQSPLVFAARSYGDLSSWHRNPGLGGVDMGLLAPEISLRNFYPPHMDVGPSPF